MYESWAPENDLIKILPSSYSKAGCAFSRVQPEVPFAFWSEFWDWGGAEEDRHHRQRDWEHPWTHWPLSLWNLSFKPKSNECYQDVCGGAEEHVWVGSKDMLSGICSLLGWNLRKTPWSLQLEKVPFGGRMMRLSLFRQRMGWGWNDGASLRWFLCLGGSMSELRGS